VSSASDRPETGPVAEPVTQTGRPPVPRPVPSDADAERAGDDGQHRTEAVPFPLPPLPPAGMSDAVPDPVPGPATGRLYLEDYPPRVPRADPGGAQQGSARGTAPDDGVGNTAGAGDDR
jgi:hypothetical protein